MDEHALDFEADGTRKRNLDRRRETSRHAARDRRGKEADIFTDLKDVVPIVEEATVTHVDRIALLRVASTLCRLRKNAAAFLKTSLCEETGQLFSETTLLESLDGFLSIIDSDGVILYVSESISIYLGLTQTDLTGRSLKDFVYPSDYEELSKCSSESGEDGITMSIRMKSVISPRGRNLNLKSALFKPVICRIRSIPGEGGRVCLLQGSAQPAGQGSCAAAAAKNAAEVPNGTYMTRHTCDMKFSYVSESFSHVLRQETRTLVGASFYSLVHPADTAAVASSIREMLEKGHAKTPYYRLIGANDSVIWVQTEATTVNHTSKGHKGQYIICVHDMLGSQSERESFADSGESFLIEVKKELDENADSRKNSCDEVLQWLFRDQKTVASGTTLFRAQDCQKRSIIVECDDTDPPLAKAALLSNRFDTPESSIDDITYEIGSNSPYANNAGVEYSPLAAGFADCELRSSGGSTSSGGGGGSLSSGRGSFDSGGAATAALQAFGTELSSDPLLSNVRVSNSTSDDAFTLSSVDDFGSAAASRADMYAILSSSGPPYARTMSYEPYIQTTSVINTHSQMNSLASSYKEESDDFYDSPENLQLLAPYVSHEDATQLCSDIQGLASDFFTDLLASDSPLLRSSSPEQQSVCLTSAPSPDNSTSRLGTKCNPSAGAVPYPTPSASPTGKRTTNFYFPSNASFSSTGVNPRAPKRLAAGNSCRNRIASSLMAGGDIDSAQFLQQQYRISAVKPGVLNNSCNWGDHDAADPVITFHRDGPAVQQQRV